MTEEICCVERESLGIDLWWKKEENYSDLKEILDIKTDEQLFPFKNRTLHSETTVPDFYNISGLIVFRMKSGTFRFERKC